MSRRVLDRYVEELFGLMSRRVLGQYDPVLALEDVPGAARQASALYLVEPNIAGIERDLSPGTGTDLRPWLILHELTHAWQFELHPWHRGAPPRTVMRGLTCSTRCPRMERRSPRRARWFANSPTPCATRSRPSATFRR